MFFVVLLVFDGDFGCEYGCGPEQNSRCARKTVAVINTSGRQHEFSEKASSPPPSSNCLSLMPQVAHSLCCVCCVTHISSSLSGSSCLHLPNKDALISELQSNPQTPFSEESKHMMHTVGNIECSELNEISPNIQSPYCLKYGRKGSFIVTVALAWF